MQHKKNVNYVILQRLLIYATSTLQQLDNVLQKYKGRVVLRGDAVKDDSGSNAVFFEQGSSASHVTAATVLDVISRLPGCACKACDAVSAHTQVKMEDAPKLLRLPESECPVIWIRILPSRSPKSLGNMPDLVVPFERHLYGHPLAVPLWDRKLSVLFDEGMGNSTRMGMLIYASKLGFSISFR